MDNTDTSQHITISKENVLPHAQDYYALREESIALLEKIGSKLWTDYNIHDPGITFLEALCYAITDLSYRTSYDVKDLIAEAKPENFNADVQTLFSAREILTTAPWTINDYRKLLIDLEEVRNAWLTLNTCDNYPRIYVDCKKSELTYSKKIKEITLKGLYNVLLELEEDKQNGDLNSGKVSISIHDPIVDDTLYLEVRFPSIQEFNLLEIQETNLKYFRHPDSKINNVTVKYISDKKNPSQNIDESLLIGALKNNLYATIDISFENTTLNKNLVVEFKDVPFKFNFLTTEVRQKFTLNTILSILQDNTVSGVAWHYLLKIQSIDNAVETATATLQSHRNLCEDFCNVNVIEIEEFGICADMEIKPDADIEKVLSEVYLLIEEYLNPSIIFYSLSSMLEKTTVDKIFEGPKLDHGFIDDDDLEENVLNRTIYSSDIIELIMDLTEVINIKNFVLVRYDEEGNRIESDTWKLEVKPNHLPRFYLEGSKILVYKNGLPFLPDISELMDTMYVERGKNMTSKLIDHDLDIDVPLGSYYPMQDYYAIQNSLPIVYGTGYEGLPSSASDLRVTQAKQLKAYLAFFEQLLVNYLSQLSNLKKLFSIDNTIDKTYFPILLSDEQIKNNLYNDLFTDFYLTLNGEKFDQDKLQEITESNKEFLDRRNRFLDHLLARFNESFSDYALLLYSFKTQKKIALENLIKTKTSFLKQFPWESAFKAQSFDYTVKQDICLRRDLSGIHQRISALLGQENSLNYFEYNIAYNGDSYSTKLQLFDDSNNVILESKDNIININRDELINQINLNISIVKKNIIDKNNFKVEKIADNEYKIEFMNSALFINNSVFATHVDAETEIDRIFEFANNNLADEKFLIVEHLLLRPRSKSDILLPVCVEPTCDFCGNEDPYSYKLTFVFDGNSELAMQHFNFRAFAEQTIHSELPAHLLAKICWVGNYQEVDQTYCNWLNASEHNRSALLNDFLKIFMNLKSIYPPSALYDCTEDYGETPILLNQTQLPDKTKKL